MNETNIVRTLIVVIFFLILIYTLLRVGVGLDFGVGPYVEN